MAKKNNETIKISLKKGLVGVPEKHIKIVKALGLNKLQLQTMVLITSFLVVAEKN